MARNLRAHSARLHRVGALATLATLAPLTPALAQVTEVEVSTKAALATVAVDGQSRVIVAWSELPNPIQSSVYDDLFVRRFHANLAANGAIKQVSHANGRYHDASIAMSFEASSNASDAAVFLATIADLFGEHNGEQVFIDEFSYNQFDVSTLGPPDENLNPGIRFISSGVRRTGAGTIAFTSQSGDPPVYGAGLLYQLGVSQPTTIRSCAQFSDCYSINWQPCVARRGDGYFVIVWGEPVDPDVSSFDIFLQQYDAAGNPVPASGGETRVNADFGVAMTEESPAISFEGDDIVVVWVSPRPPGCDGPLNRIMGRRLRFNPSGLPALLGQFVADDASSVVPELPHDANPTVSLLKTNGNDDGRFVVGWNGVGAGNSRHIRGRLFDSAGQRRGREFEVTALSDYSTNDLIFDPSLADSGQHTLAYRPDGGIVAAWTLREHSGLADSRVYLTLLEPSFSANLFTRGDCNTDGRVDGEDIQPFVNAAINAYHPRSPACATPTARRRRGMMGWGVRLT